MNNAFSVFKRGLTFFLATMVLLMPIFSFTESTVSQEELEEIELQMQASREKLEEEYARMYYEWTVQEQYDFAQMYEAYWHALGNMDIPALPGDAHVQEDDAIEMAMNAVRETYGEDAFDIGDTLDTQMSFQRTQEDTYYWWLDLFLREGMEVKKVYHVMLDGETGEALIVDNGEEGHG